MSRTYYRTYFLLFFLSGECMFLVFSQVFQLTEHNFDKLVRDKDVMLIEFYMPWCKHCQALQPQWEEVEQVLEKNHEYILGKVNCWEDGKSLCDKVDVQMYPEIRLYRHGKFIEAYEGERNSESILEYIERAQATTGKVGSVPFWEKLGAGDQPPEGHAPLEPGPPAAAAAPVQVMPPPTLAPVQPLPPLVNPPVVQSAPVPQHPNFAPPAPPLPPHAYQPNSTDILFTQTVDLGPPSLSAPSHPPALPPPQPQQPPVMPQLPPPPPPSPPRQAPLPIHPNLPPPPQTHPPMPITKYQPPPAPKIAPSYLSPPAQPVQSSPISEMALAYNLAVSQQDASTTPQSFWNNFKFWHDFLQFVNHGPHTFINNPQGYPNRQLLPNDYPLMLPLSSYSPDYQQQPKLPSSPFILPTNNRVNSNPSAMNGMLVNNFVNPLQQSSQGNEPLNDILANTQYTENNVAANMADCQLRHDCPQVYQTKAPVYYIPPMNYLSPANTMRTKAFPATINFVKPVSMISTLPSLISEGGGPSFIGLAPGLRKTKLPEKKEKPIPYIRPSVYKLLRRKKPNERFIKRPIVQGRYAVPISKAMKQQMQLKANMKALARRPVPPINRNRIMEIERLRAQYALRRPQSPKTGSALIRGKVQKPFPVQRNPLRKPPAPMKPGVAMRPSAPFNIASAKKRVPLPNTIQLQNSPYARNAAQLNQLRNRKVNLATPKNRSPPLIPQKKRLLPPSIRKQILTPYERTRLLPPNLRKGLFPSTLRKVIPQQEHAIKKMQPPTNASVATPVKRDPDLVNIWDRLYRFYTTQGKDVQYDSQASHEIKQLSPIRKKPSGIAVVERFLESKFKDMKKDRVKEQMMGEARHGIQPYHNQVKTDTPVIRVPKGKKMQNLAVKKRVKGQQLFFSLPTNISSQGIPKGDENILKAISHIPQPWDKRGKVTFALSKKNEIPGAPRITGVWGSLRRRKKKRRKRRKKRSLADSNCAFLDSLTSADISYFTDIQRLSPNCLHNTYLREDDYG